MEGVRKSAYLCQKSLIHDDSVAVPVWFKVRKALGHEPIVAGRVPGSEPLFAERYIYQDIERTVPPLDLSGALVVQFGGGRVHEGEPDRWRSVNLPTQSLVLPPATATHWHYSGTVDFAVFYFLDPPSRSMRSLAMLADSRGEPVPFSDALVGAAALQLVGELQKGAGADAKFMEQLAGVMLEQSFRALVTPGTRGINPRHVHFFRVQAVLQLRPRQSRSGPVRAPPRGARRREPGPFRAHVPGRGRRATPPLRASGTPRPRAQAAHPVHDADRAGCPGMRLQFAESPDGELPYGAFDDAGAVSRPGPVSRARLARAVWFGCRVRAALNPDSR